MWWLALVGCIGPQPTVHVRSPEAAGTLLLRLAGPGSGDHVEFAGKLSGETQASVDPDEAWDAGYPIVIQVLSSDDTVLYATTRREPAQIRQAVASFGLGVDLFELVPQLGDFAVAYPQLADADHVRVFRREADGSTTELGGFSLTVDVPGDDADRFQVDGIEQLRDATPPDRALDIVFLGDGYTADELGEFADDADRAMAGFLATSPFDALQDHINFWRVDVASAESGAGFDCSDDVEVPGCVTRLRDTAYQSVFPLRLAGMVSDADVADDVLLQLDQWSIARAADHVPHDAVVVIVNTPKPGAFGVWQTSIDNGPGLDQGVVHEFGHAFGLLGDEYVAAGNGCQVYPGIPDFPNVHPFADDPDDVRWKAWLTPGIALPTADGTDGVGLFAGSGGGCEDRYRPMEHCLMRQWGEPTCPVCAEQLVKRMFTAIDAIRGVTYQRGTMTAVSDFPIEGEWLVDGEPAGPADQPLAVDGHPTVELRARAISPFVRTDPESLDEVVEVRFGE
jgi:hypothetical protein